MDIFIGLVFYSHAKPLVTTCMAASFQQEGKLGPIKSSLTLSLLIEHPVLIQQNEQSCNVCVRDIDFAFSYDFTSFFPDVAY